MQWSEIQFNPPTRTLRQFAVLWIVFFAGLAVWQVGLRGHIWPGVSLAILAVTIGSLGLFKPSDPENLCWLDDSRLSNWLDCFTDRAGTALLWRFYACRPFL